MTVQSLSVSESLHAEETGNDADHQSGSYRRCSLLKSRWRLALLVGAIFVVIVFVAYSTLPGYLLGSRLQHAQVSMQGVNMIIDDTSTSLKMNCRAFASKDLLWLPLTSFNADVQGRDLTAYVMVDAIPRPGEVPGKVPAAFGTLHIGKFQVSSSKDIDLDMAGEFEITSDTYMSQLVRQSIKQPSIVIKLNGVLDIWAKVWGWMPIAFHGIEFTYDVEVTAFDNFRSHGGIVLDEIKKVEGSPGKLELGCTAKIYNPTFMSMEVRDTMQLRVGYNYSGAEFFIGTLAAPDLTIVPGDNVVTGKLFIEQTSENQEAIGAVAAAYMGGVQDGFGPSGTQPFIVMVHDSGDETAKSPILRSAMHGLSIMSDFRPKPFFCVKRITTDVVIIGSMVHWPPALYLVTVYVWVHNPLPQEVRVRGVDLAAYHTNLTGNLLYTYQHSLNSSEYVVPALTEVPLPFKLSVAEVNWPSFGDVKQLIGEAAQRKITVGVDGKFMVTVMDGFETTANYKNDAIYSVICYHAFVPKQRCGDAPPQGTLESWV